MKCVLQYKYKRPFDDDNQIRRLSLCSLAPVVGAFRAPDAGAGACLGLVDGDPD